MSDMERLKIVGKWVLVEKVLDTDKCKNIIIPESILEDSTTKGQVVAVNESHGDKNIKLHDVVLFKRKNNNAYSIVELDGTKYLKMLKDQILGVVFGDKPSDIAPTSDNIFVEWEESSPVFKGSNLVRPDKFRQNHYTGVVIDIGYKVEEVKKGDRIFFDQFSRFENFEDTETQKRYAFVKESAVLASVPSREEIGTLEKV